MEINVVEKTRAVPFSELYAGDIFRFVNRVTDFEPGLWMKTDLCDEDYDGYVIVCLDTGETDIVKFDETRETLVEEAKSISMTVEF